MTPALRPQLGKARTEDRCDQAVKSIIGGALLWGMGQGVQPVGICPAGRHGDRRLADALLAEHGVFADFVDDAQLFLGLSGIPCAGGRLDIRPSPG